MRKLISALLLIASMLIPQAAFAWHAAGHKAVALFAYRNLNPNTQSIVDELLTHHPNFQTWVQGVPQNQRGAVAFMNAATWPDVIKFDGKHQNDKCDAMPTNMGFTDVKEHRCWHFMDVPFSTDGTQTQPPGSPNALMKIVEFRNGVGNTSLSKDVRAYDLSWLIHLVGDIHQPLHSSSRFSQSKPNGDGGGNSYPLVIMVNGKKQPSDLHSFWDALLGEDERSQTIMTITAQLMAQFKQADMSEINIPSDALAEQTVRGWIGESASLSEYFVYNLDDAKQGSNPPLVPAAYSAYARDIARHRVAIAGYRLAAILNDKVR